MKTSPTHNGDQMWRPRTGKKILIHEEFDLVDFRRAYRSRNQNKVAEDDDDRVEKMIIRCIYLAHCLLCCLQGAGSGATWRLDAVRGWHGHGETFASKLNRTDRGFLFLFCCLLSHSLWRRPTRSTAYLDQQQHFMWVIFWRDQLDE